MATGEPAVAVRDLRKRFGEDAVLDGLDLEARAGEVTLLMGPNGVGKTILLSCVTGGLHPDGGAVEVLGRPPGDARADLSFMLQDAMLVDELTGRENVAFFRDLHPRATDGWRELLEALAFDADALDREVADYSGGMKRKLELAVALSADVPLYVLDEPTAALDVTTVDRLHSLLAERAAAGDTVLMSSHLPLDARLADRVAVLTGAGVVATGAPGDLLADVPRVVHVEGLADGVADHLRDGRLFETGSERSGFLADGADPETVEAAVDAPGTSVRVTDPAVTDLYNYYVHVAGR